MNISLFAFLGLSLFRSFETINPVAEKARSYATELATVPKEPNCFSRRGFRFRLGLVLCLNRPPKHARATRLGSPAGH